MLTQTATNDDLAAWEEEMGQQIELQLEPRTVLGKNTKKLRRQGLLPGVIYGFNIQESTPVQVEARLFERVYHRAGNVHLVDLRVGAQGNMTRAFISAVKRDPVSHHPTHVDFRVVNLRIEITAQVPIVLTGEPQAVKDGVGLLMQSLDGLTIKVLPTEVPETFSADVSGLAEVGDTLHVKDLPLPAGVTLLTDPEEVIARITAVSVEPVEEEAATEGAEAEAAAGESAGDASAS